MRSLILLTLFSSSLFADYGVARVWHLTQRTDKEVCAITVVKYPSGRIRSERYCFGINHLSSK